MMGSKDVDAAKFTHSKRQFSHTGRQFTHSARQFSKTSSKSSDKLPSLDDVFHAENSKGKLNRGARRQLLLTLSGAGLLVLSFLLAGATGWLTVTSTRESAGSIGLEIRRRTAQSVQTNVAETLRPAYVTTRQLQEQAKSGLVGGKVWEPNRENFERNYNKVFGRLWTQLEPEIHTSRVSADGADKEHIPFLGLAFQVALQADLETPATGMAECGQVLTIAMYHGPFGPAGSTVTTAVYPTFAPNPMGGEVVTHLSTLYSPEAYRPFPRPIGQVPRHCHAMLRVWGDAAQRNLKNFNNVSWEVPSIDNLQAFTAVSPVRGPSGEPVGFFSAGISLLRSIYPTLVRTVEEDAGGMLIGAEIALVTGPGLILGATELSDTQGDETLADLPRGGLLARAVEVIAEEAGSHCPEGHVVIDKDDRLMDAIPFKAEDYGMPPLPERWCVILTIPRKNIYQAIDHSQSTTIKAGFINLGMFVLSIALLVISFCLAVWSDRGLRNDKLRGDLRHVMRSVKEVNALNCPMAVVSAEVFLKLTRLEYFESLRDDGLVTVLDSLEAIARFKEQSMIVFFSHQWLSFTFPDTKGSVQLAAMQGAIRTLMADPETTKNVYVWCDFISIAQRHPKMQHAAIASLPVYARVADKFVIVAPTATHEDLECECNLETYNKRGWCRTEMLAKACGSGIEEMYTCTDKEGTLSTVTVEDLRNLSFSVMEGDFAVREDIEDLVGPILGLYSLVLRESHLPHMQVLHEHIKQDKDRFFPKSYRNESSGEKVELFGNQVKLLETYITKGLAACGSRRALQLQGGGSRPGTPSTATPRSLATTPTTSAPVTPTRLGAPASPKQQDFAGTASEQLLLP